MAAICQSFVQNAWKKDLCSNCFKSREEHGKGNNVNSAKSRYLSPSTTLTGRGLYAPAGSWKEIVIQTQANNGRRGTDGTVSPPSSCASPQSPTLLSSAEPCGILKTPDQRAPRRKTSGVCFPDQVEHVIGYGGCENGSDDDDEYFSGDDVSGDESENELSEEERMLFRLTKKNTDFNSVKSNLMKDPDTPAPEPLTKRAFAQLLLAASRTPSGAPENRKSAPPLVSVKPFVRDSMPGELKVSLVSPMINGELITNSKRPSQDEDMQNVAENEQVKENNAANCVEMKQNGEVINCNNHNNDDLADTDDSDNGEMIIKENGNCNNKMENGEVGGNEEKDEIKKVEVSINLQQKNVISDPEDFKKQSDTEIIQPSKDVEMDEKRRVKEESNGSSSPPVEGKQLGTPRSSFLHGIIIGSNNSSNTSESVGKPPILRDKPRLPVKPTKPLRETEQRPQKSLKQRVEEDLREKLRQKEEEEKQRREEEERLAREKDEALQKLKQEEAEKMAQEKRKQEEAERLAEDRRKQEEAKRLEEEKRKHDEAERLAEEKRKQDEAERIAQERRKQEETEKQVQEQLKQEEAERIAHDKRKQEEAERIARDKRKQEEAEKQALEERKQEEAERILQEQRKEAAERIAQEHYRQVETERVAQEQSIREKTEIIICEKNKTENDEQVQGNEVIVQEISSECSTSDSSEEEFACKEKEKQNNAQEKKTEIEEMVKQVENDSQNRIYLDISNYSIPEVVRCSNEMETKAKDTDNRKDSSNEKERRPSLPRELEEDPNAGKRSVGKRQAPRPPIPMSLQDSGPESATSSASTASLSSLSSPGSPDDMPASAEDKKRGRFSLKRLLRLGSGGSREEERRSAALRTPPAHPPPRPEIIHPLDRNIPGVEVIRGTSRDVQRRLMSEQRAGRPKPPPPPRWVDGGSPPKPARPPPPRSGDLLKQQGTQSSVSYCAKNSSPEDNVYANIVYSSVAGTGRTGLAPHKPQRSASLRETAQGSSKRRDSDVGYETPQGVDDENPYEVVRITGARNRYIKNPRAAFSLRRRSCESSATSERPSSFSRSMSLPLGSESSDDGQLPDAPSPWRSPRAAIPRTLDDSYSAISAANHEALAFVLEQVSGYPPAIPPALRGLRGSGLRWADFSVDSSNYMQVGPRVFIQASWGPHPVTLLLSTAPDRGTLPPRSPHAPPAMAEFTDAVPGSYLCQINSEVQAFISVLPELEVETLGTFAASRLGGIPLEVPADVQDAMFILLQLIHTLKLLQARGVEDSSPAHEVALIRGMTDDSFRLVFLGDSGEMKSTLCQGALNALYLLLGAFDGEVPVNMPFRDAIKAVITTLSEERAGSLSRAKSILESILWGPVTSPDSDDAALQRWLDVERAAALGGALRWGLTVSAPSIREELHLVFLVRACTRSLRECTVSS